MTSEIKGVMDKPLYEGLKFTYVRDPACPAHVVTFGRKWADETKTSLITVFCANKVTLSEVAYREDGYKPKWIVLDPFRKEIARHVCVQRLLKSNYAIVPVREKEKVIEAILDFYSGDGSRAYEPHHEGDSSLGIPETVSDVCGRALFAYEHKLSGSNVIRKMDAHPTSSKAEAFRISGHKQ